MPLTPAVLAVITFVCSFGGAVVGAFIRDRLPEPHLSKESQDVVKLGMGLVATMTALVLGLVTAAARSAFDVQDVAVRNSATNILTMDRHLARYGPETAPIRKAIRDAVAARIEAIWPESGGGSLASSFEQTPPRLEAIETELLELPAETEAKRWFKSESVRLSEDVLKARWRALGSGGSIPTAFLTVVIFWLTMTFASFGLYAPRNVTVMGVLFVASLSVAAAIFLLMELDGPFDGLIKVPSAPLRFALENLGK